MQDGQPPMDASKAKAACTAAKTAMEKMIKDSKVLVGKLVVRDDLYDTMNLDLCARVCSCSRLLFHTFSFAVTMRV